MLMNDIKISLTTLKTSEPHTHSGLQCIFLLRGSVTIDLDGEKIKMSADDLIVINPHQSHMTLAEENNVTLVLEVQPDYLKHQSEGFAQGMIRCHCIGHSDRSSHFFGLKRSLTRMLYAAIKKESGHQFAFKTELFHFIHILFANFSDKDANVETTENQNAQRRAKNINHILIFLDENFHHPLKLEDVAKREHMSPQNFSKYFKRKTGTGFTQYMNALRLKKSLPSLVETEDSITKIALNYGFANAKSFTVAFKKAFNDTPGNFRKEHKMAIKQKPEEFNIAIVDLSADMNIRDFLQYMSKYDNNIDQGVQNNQMYHIAMDNVDFKKLQPQEHLLNIGKAECAPSFNLLNRFELLKHNLGFKYIYFELEHHFITNNIQYSKIVYQHFFNVVDQAKRVGMSPFLKFKVEQPFKNCSLTQISRRVKAQINAFISCVKPVYDNSFLTQWKIQVYPEQTLSNDINFAVYEKVYKSLKCEIPGLQVGYHGFVDPCESQIIQLQQFLKRMKLKKCLPCFLTFSAFANHKVDNYLANEFFFSGLRGYFAEISQIFKVIYEEIEQPPLYMTEWNTLMGDLDQESILYLRSAIILEALFEVNSFVKGVGCWADTSISAIHGTEAPVTSLSLYLIDEVRRPIYTILEMVRRLGTKVLYKEKDILVTVNDNGEYNVLIWNPHYLNPSFSMDNSTTDPLYKNVNVKLSNLPANQYQIKRLTADKESSGFISHIMNAGYPDFSDQEVFNYIKYNIAHGLTVYQESILNGSYILNTNLSYNGVVLYILKQENIY